VGKKREMLMMMTAATAKIQNRFAISGNAAKRGAFCINIYIFFSKSGGNLWREGIFGARDRFNYRQR